MEKKKYKILTSFLLHIIAMSLMFIDHFYKTLIDSNMVLIILGRLSFPIFAFMIANGYRYTKDVKKYIKRIFIFALISEIPFNLCFYQSISYIEHQNVMWTFLIAILTMYIIDYFKSKKHLDTYIVALIVVTLIAMIIAMVMCTDYNGFGVLTVLIFYFFNKDTLFCKFMQLISMIFVHGFMYAYVSDGLYSINVSLLGYNFMIPEQSFAILSLIIIWLYNGKQGYHKKWFQYFCYAFYPLHMLILAFVQMCVK